MVSKFDRRRAVRVSLTLGLVASLTVAGGCSRRAEIENAPTDPQLTPTDVPRPDAGVPLVAESGLELDVDACRARPVQIACAGTNDFGCALDDWLPALAESCQYVTDCHTNGWIEIETAESGCVDELRMEDPNPDFVACLVAELNRYRCPSCKGAAASSFLGASHDGCEPLLCGTGELRCPPGWTCQGRLCERDEAAAGAASE